MNLNDFSKWLQYNKEWKIEWGLNTFRTHCIYIYIYINKNFIKDTLGPNKDTTTYKYTHKDRIHNIT